MNFEEKTKKELELMGVDTSPTSIVHDLFIRKHVDLISPIFEKVESYLERMDFTDYDKVSPEDMKRWAGNFLLAPREGEKSRGVIRLYFGNPVNITVREGTIFTTLTGLRFKSQAQVKVDADEMVSYTTGIYYYVDVDVVSEGVGETQNLEAGTSFTCSDPTIASMALRIENTVKFQGGEDPETPQELYNRLRHSLAVRSLANDPSIQTVIRDAFPAVTKIYTVPTGSEEMFRDRLMVDINGSPTEVRVGNKTDIYVATSHTISRTVTVYNQEKRKIPFGYNCPTFVQEGIKDVVFKVLNVYPVDSSGTTGIPLTEWRYQQKLHHENSIYQDGYLIINDENYIYSEEEDAAPPFYFAVEYIGSDIIADIQALIHDPSKRMPVGDQLIKGFSLTLLRGTIVYSGDVSEAVANQAMIKFIEEFEGGTLELSDIIGMLRGIGATRVVLPIELLLEKANGDLVPLNTKEEGRDVYNFGPSEMCLLHPYLFAIVNM